MGRCTPSLRGPVNTGGFSAGGNSSSVQKNFPTVGRLIDGATVERRDINADFNARTSLTLSLQQPDFTTVTRVSDAINALFYDEIASAADAWYRSSVCSASLCR